MSRSPFFLHRVLNSDWFDQALPLFAEAYADQNERDHQALLDAVKAGRLTAAAATA